MFCLKQFKLLVFFFIVCVFRQTQTDWSVFVPAHKFTPKFFIAQPVQSQAMRLGFHFCHNNTRRATAAAKYSLEIHNVGARLVVLGMETAQSRSDAIGINWNLRTTQKKVGRVKILSQLLVSYRIKGCSQISCILTLSQSLFS